jgi:hypothetical protein
MRFIGMGGWGCWLQRESSAAKQDTYYKYHKYHIIGSSKPFFRFFTLSTLRKLLTTASVCCDQTPSHPVPAPHPGLIPSEETDTALDETTCNQAARAELGGGRIVEAVDFLGGGAFPIDFERFFGRPLHTRREFKALNARFEIGLAGTSFELLGNGF